MSPGAALAVHFPESMVQQHVGRAGRVRACEVADLGVEAEDCFDGVTLEPPVEQLARAPRHDLPKVALRAAREERELAAQGERAKAAAPVEAEVGRGL